eukprot:gene2393-2873_t
MVLYNSTDLWLEYIDFIEQQVKNTHTLVSVTSRAVIGCRDNGSLWRLRLYALEAHDPEDSTSFDCAVAMALAQSFHSSEEYLSILTWNCDFYRRRLLTVTRDVEKQRESTAADIGVDVNTFRVQSAVAAVRTAFDSADMFLCQYYPEWAGAHLSVALYRLRVTERLM